MKRLSFVVVSAFVLGLGLSVSAEQSRTHPRRARSRRATLRPAIAADRPASPQLAHQRRAANAQTALVKQYCATCHNDRNKNNAGGLSLAGFDASKVGHDAQVAEVAEKMIRKLRSGMMPPPNARRPEARGAHRSFAASMESRLDQRRGAQSRIPAAVRSSA